MQFACGPIVFGAVCSFYEFHCPNAPERVDQAIQLALN